MHAVINRIGKGAVNAHCFGQLELQVLLIAEGRRPVRFERNRDEMEVTLGPAEELKRQAPLATLALWGRGVGGEGIPKCWDLAGEVDGVAGVVAEKLGRHDRYRVLF